MDMKFLYAAIAIMIIMIAREVLKKRYGFDMDNIDIQKVKSILKIGTKSTKQNVQTQTQAQKQTGKQLVLITSGDNKATVMATLRQITGLDYNSAKNIVNSTPSVFMTNVSDTVAEKTKKALEFVGAKVEIK